MTHKLLHKKKKNETDLCKYFSTVIGLATTTTANNDDDDTVFGVDAVVGQRKKKNKINKSIYICFLVVIWAWASPFVDI